MGDDNQGTITDATSAGVSISAAQANMMLKIEVDPASIPALDSDALYANVFVTPVNIVTNYALGVIGEINPRYPQNENLSSS